MAPATRVRNTIRALRFQRGEMTQQQLADSVGLSRQTIIAIEQGRYSPSLEAAFKIARVFRVPLEEVFQYDAQPRPPRDALTASPTSRGRSPVGLRVSLQRTSSK